MSDEFGSGHAWERPTGAFGDGARDTRSGLDAAAVERPTELVEVSGRIKWFDVAKGFGFIVPDSGAPDVLLHVTCLRRDGHQSASEGARIVVEAVQRQRGWQAFRGVFLNLYLGSPRLFKPNTHRPKPNYTTPI